MDLLSRFLTISTADPDDTRRRRILNILVVSVGILSLLVLITSFAVIVLKLEKWENVRLLVIGSSLAIFGLLVIYLINIFWSGRVAATIFLLFLTVVFSFDDTPEQ